MKEASVISLVINRIVVQSLFTLFFLLSSSTTQAERTRLSAKNDNSSPYLVNVNVLDHLNDVNIVVVTDVHSWVAGHGRHEPYLNADYGDILSWYQHFQALAHEADRDLFFVMNGDFVYSKGLSQQDVPPRQLVPILQHMPFSAINLGNHEIYHNETIRFLASSFIQHWNGTFLTSNTVWADTGEPIGDRYTYWKCRQRQHNHQHQQQEATATILVFGFLFNDQQFCKNVRVETVQETIQQAWFHNVLHDQSTFQAIVVLAHMGYLDPLVQLLLRAIRDIVGPGMVIQFIDGHTHERGFTILNNDAGEEDPLASAFEAGHFLDTVGFISFPLLLNGNIATTATASNSSSGSTAAFSAASSSIFAPVFLDTNTQVLANALGEDNLVKTKDGQDLSQLIYDTRVSMGLTRVVGCSNTTYFLRANDDDSSSSSLWGLYMNKVIPSVLLEYNASKVFVQSTSAFKCNLWMGNVTIDDLIEMSPYDNPIYNVVNQISGSDLMNVLRILGASNANPFLPNLPQIAVSASPSLSMTAVSNSPTTTSAGGGESSTRLLPDQFYDLYAGEWDTSFIAPVVANVTGRQKDECAPVLYMQHEHDKPPRLWTTGRVWRDFVARAWPCPIVTTNTGPLVPAYSSAKIHPATISFSTTWCILVPLAVIPFLSWVIYLVKVKRLNYLSRRTTLDSCSENTRLIDHNGDEYVIRVNGTETYHSI